MAAVFCWISLSLSPHILGCDKYYGGQKLSQTLSSSLWDCLFTGILDPQILACLHSSELKFRSSYSVILEQALDHCFLFSLFPVPGAGKCSKGLKEQGVNSGLKAVCFLSLCNFWLLPNLSWLPWLIPNAFKGICSFCILNNFYGSCQESVFWDSNTTINRSPYWVLITGMPFTD